MTTCDEPDFRIVELEGMVGIACQHLRDDNQAINFDGCYMMNLPKGILDERAKLYYCPACEPRGGDDLKQLVVAYLIHMLHETGIFKGGKN